PTAGIHEVERVVVGIAIEIETSSAKSEWIFADESGQLGREISGPVVQESIAVIFPAGILIQVAAPSSGYRYVSERIVGVLGGDAAVGINQAHHASQDIGNRRIASAGIGAGEEFIDAARDPVCYGRGSREFLDRICAIVKESCSGCILCTSSE